MAGLKSSVGGGLAFYWALTTAASEISGGARAVVTLEAPGRQALRSSAGDGSPRRVMSDEQRGGGPGGLPPELSVRLQVEAEHPARGDGEWDPEAFARSVDLLLLCERSHRGLRFARARIQAFEAQVGHDLRKLLQPLLLHVEELRRRGSPSAEDLELLDDLTRSLVEGVEELQAGGLAEDVRNPSSSRTEGTDLPAALQEVLDREPPRAVATSIPDRLPALDVDGSSLRAGLRELIHLADSAGGALRVSRGEDGSVRIRAEVDGDEPPAELPGSASDERPYPPVVGGLLNLTARMDGALRLEASSGGGGRIDVRLPGSGREE